MPAEDRVRLDDDVAVQITCWRAGFTCLAFAGDADSLPLVNAGRNAHGDHALLELLAGSAARRAEFAHDSSAPAAIRAGRDHAEHPAEPLLCDASLPAA